MKVIKTLAAPPKGTIPILVEVVLPGERGTHADELNVTIAIAGQHGHRAQVLLPDGKNRLQVVVGDELVHACEFEIFIPVKDEKT